MHRNTVLALGLLAAGLLIGGCAGDKQDLEQWVDDTLARPPGPIEPLPEVSTPEPVTYDAYDLRDPFMRMQQDDAPEAVAVESGPRPDPNRRREYLERFPLDTLDMVGTIAMDDSTYGLIEDAEGTIHRVSQGDYMGQNHGRILRVTPGAIELMELVPDGANGWMEREARIALAEQGGRNEG